MTGVLAWLWANCAGNLVASGITGAVVWLWGRRHIAALHSRLDQQDSHLAAIHQATGGQP